MNTLRVGSSGPEVVRLQEQLTAAGFGPGSTDGDFGPATQAAVMAFQRSRGMLEDGVAGPRTLKALALRDDDTLESVLPRVTAEAVAAMFPRATPRANIERYLPDVLAALADAGLHDRRMVLMALATIRAESEAFAPVSEGQSRFNTAPGGPPFGLYDRREDIGNHGPPDGERFRGRGFVQLTGRDNYAKYGQRLGLGTGLVEHPDRANESGVAARVLAAFLRDKELRIKRALVSRDLAGARRAVNGGAHGLDRFIDTYLAGEQRLA